MSSLEKTKEQVLVTAGVVRSGTAITVPEQMALPTAIKVIQSTIDYEDKVIRRTMDFDADPLDVANAFGKAIREICGQALGMDTVAGFFRTNPPTEITTEVAPGEYVKTLWGQIAFPFDPGAGSFETSANQLPSGVYQGRISGTFRQKYEKVWDQIVAATRNYLNNDSMFKGRTLRIRFTDEDGDQSPWPEIRPWDVKNASNAKLVFSKKLEGEIEDHILTPITQYEICRKSGIPFKRGVLLSGKYGTGKTELAAKIAAIASALGMAVIYIENVRELPHAIRFAARLAPAIVFAEDLDRVGQGERDHKMDVLLNTLDGIDTKKFPIMTILTTNYPEKIYEGMVRRGRIDVILEIEAPDAEASVRLVHNYLGEMYFGDDAGEEAMGEALAGMIPADIKEICERSKLSYISRTKQVPAKWSISPDDIIRAAGSMYHINHEKPSRTIVTQDEHQGSRAIA